MEDAYKEVYFYVYCGLCKYYEQDEDEEPCCECLNSPINVYSHRPMNFKEKDDA